MDWKMNRRDFSAQLVGLGVTGSGLLAGAPVLAQGGFVENTHYVRLAQPAPTSAPAGKVEVIEFFWYGCPHCHAFEPALEAWVKKLPDYVSFRRVPVAFREIYAVHQQIYYALEALGKVDAMHRKVFYAIHNDRKRLEKPDEIADLMAANGIDRAKFLEAFNSFGVQTKVRQASKLVDAYKIDGVPALGVQGRYFTSGSLAGTPERSLAVTDFLIERTRKGA
jgi:protein dithiol oxidoreductase (disulfide-forming)